MLLERMRSPSIYLEEPLRELCAGAIPDVTFADLPKRLLVNTVDLERGARVVWGLPGLEDVSVRDAVYASCALPGFFPPGRVGDRTCIDGGVVDNLPVSVASQFADIIIAVDVGSSDGGSAAGTAGQGFAGTYMRAATMMMHALQQFPLERWHGPPMVLIRPRVDDANWLSFSDTAANIAEGYRVGDARPRALRLLLGPAELRLSRAGACRSTSTWTSAPAAAPASRSPRPSWGSTARARRSRAPASSSGRRPTAASCTSARPRDHRVERGPPRVQHRRAGDARPDAEWRGGRSGGLTAKRR